MALSGWYKGRLFCSGEVWLGKVGSERKGQHQEREGLELCPSSSSHAALMGTWFPLAEVAEGVN